MVDKKVEMSQKAVRMARHQNFQMAKWSKKKPAFGGLKVLSLIHRVDEPKEWFPQTFLLFLFRQTPFSHMDFSFI